MQPEQQLKHLIRVWPQSKEGYVFLPWIPAKEARTQERRKHWHEGKAFHWPDEKAQILAHLHEHVDDELYFTPMIFDKPYRREEHAILGSRLWADLDEVDPRDIPEYYQPTHAWETSPGRYAGIWVMATEREDICKPGHENQKLTYWLEADRSGWDAPQLLRVPGSANNKAAYAEGTRGSVLWWSRERHAWTKIDEMPDVDVPKAPDIRYTEKDIAEIDRNKVWNRVRLQLPYLVRDYMHMRKTEGLDRSEVAWQIERELADVGCSVAEIVAIIQPSIWNKFADRTDEMKRLVAEATKAVSDRPETLEDTTVELGQLVPFWKDTEYLTAPEPDWLIPGLIPKGGCGFIGGIPKSLKSWLALDLGISLSTGTNWLGVDIEEAVPTLYIQEEDPSTLVRFRHNIIASSKDEKYRFVDDEGKPVARIVPYPAGFYTVVYKGFRANDAAWQAWLLETVETLGIKLVILDTLTTVSPAVDMISDVKPIILDPLKNVARSTGSAIAIVHHMNKARTDSRAGQNLAGGGQIHAWADWGFYVTGKDDKRQLISIDHETKYTGTTPKTYSFDGIPERWELTPLEDEPSLEPEAQPLKSAGANGSKARALMSLEEAALIDPLAADLDVDDIHKRKRAMVKAVADQMGKVSAGLTKRRFPHVLSSDGITKLATELARDYPDSPWAT